MSYVVAFVYYYPPTLNVANIHSITFDSFTQCVNMNYVPGLNSLNPLADWGSVSLYMTPEAYTNWYNDTYKYIQNSAMSADLTAMYQQMSARVGNYPNQEAATQAYIGQKGWSWLAYSNWLGSVDYQTQQGQQLFNAWEASNTNELYVLLSTNPADGNDGTGTAAPGTGTPPTPPPSVNTQLVFPPWVPWAIIGIGALFLIVLLLRYSSGAAPIISAVSQARERSTTSKIAREQHEMAKGRESERKEKAKAQTERIKAQTEATKFKTAYSSAKAQKEFSKRDEGSGGSPPAIEG